MPSISTATLLLVTLASLLALSNGLIVRRQVDGTTTVTEVASPSSPPEALLEVLADQDAIPDVASTTPGVFEAYSPQAVVEVCNEKNAPGRSTVYCSGKLLDAVNRHSIFSDSKTFVDRPMKSGRTADVIMAAFNSKFPMNVSDIDKDSLLQFVEENFDKEGKELEECSLLDWSESPRAFAGITDQAMYKFAIDLNNIWKQLCRKIKPIVKEEPHRFSLIYTPHHFIAPGGRFRELYYWDTYWIIKGLIASGMLETARGMIYNFASIVNEFGFIPNGARVYYLRRSQPPLFTAMVYEYYEASHNTTFLRDVLPVVEKEMEWWKKERSLEASINGHNVTLFQYRTPANVPRPESYREDSSGAANFPSTGRQQQFYQDIGSAAESGWDFSTRWFADKKTLLTIHTTDIVPVDLNAYMCYNLNILSYLHSELGNENKQRSWRDEFLNFRDAFQRAFYVPEAKGWYDYDVRNKSHNTDFYPSIVIPLFTGCYQELSHAQSNDLYDRLADEGVFDFVGGIPMSLANDTQEQWDFPNGWAPLNHMIIEGLRKTDNPRMQQKAFMLAQKWVRANYKVWLVDKAMWEKYNVATNEPRTGGGGEYDVQAGFGWTNGAVLDLLMTYGDRLAAADDSNVVSGVAGASPMHSFSAYPTQSGLVVGGGLYSPLLALMPALFAVWYM